jgi:Uncharacterized protein conserved in bacteria (DUF2059)
VPKTSSLCFAVLSLLLVATLVRAGECSQNARKFVELLQYEDQLNAGKRACYDGTLSIPPEAIYKQNPSYFGNLHPGDARWPQVQEAYAKYVNAVCAHPTVEESLALITDKYATNLTKDELRSAIAFYSSSAGSKLISTHRLVSSALLEAGAAAQAEAAPRAMADVTKSIQSIAAMPATASTTGNSDLLQKLKTLVGQSYSTSLVIFVVGFSVLAWRQRSPAFTAAAMAFVLAVIAHVETLSTNACLVEARKTGLNVLELERSYQDWRLVTTGSWLMASVSVAAACLEWVRFAVARPINRRSTVSERISGYSLRSPSGRERRNVVGNGDAAPGPQSSR